jgi:lactoylglutathione lyase
MISGYGHLALRVENMEKSVDFYTRVLGFRKVFELSNKETGAPFIVYIHINRNVFLELFYNGTVKPEWSPQVIGFNHICFECDDINAVLQQVEAAGWPIVTPLKKGGDLNLQAWVADPDGNKIELMQIDPESPQGKISAGIPVQ